ncbi:MAG: hypothetical protein AAGF60_04335 [Pseudomonadota bacterium]
MDSGRVVQALQVGAVALGFTLVVWLLCIGLARLLHAGPAAMLRRKGTIVAACMAGVYVFYSLVLATCDGNALFGFRNCSVVNEPLADQALPLTLFVTVVGLAWLVLVALYSVVQSWRAPKRD